MDNLERINAIPFMDVFSKIGLQTQKDTSPNEFRLQIPGENRISNGSYKVNVLKNVVFANGSTRPQGTVFAFMKQYLGTQNDRDVFAWFEERFNVKTKFEKAKPNVAKKDILANFGKYMIGNAFDDQKMAAIRTWLAHRGFSHDFLNSEEGTERIKHVFSKFGFVENPATRTKGKDSKEWLPSRPVIVFPALDQDGKIVGVKMRKVNNMPEDESSKDSKSINVTGGASGVCYHSLKSVKEAKQVIIVEGEPDYVTLRMLGYDNVIGNLGGVLSCKEEIRDLVKGVQQIVVMYDNDKAGKDGAKRLSEFCKRQMFYAKYVQRNNVDGVPYKDVNEYFESGFNKSDFDEMIRNSTEIVVEDDGRGEYDSKDSKVVLTMTNDNPFIYLRKNYEFYDIYENRIVKKEQVQDWMGIDSKALKEMLQAGDIKKFYDVCYWKGGKKDHYNVLDERIILQPSNKPEIHPDIEFLIGNLCGFRKENIEWLHRAILYKYTHVNDVLVPAVLFKGVGGSGKGTFIKLLTKIFAQENVMCGLGTQSLTSDFCPYTGAKIIVEINELGGGNHKDAVRILDRLKSLIFEPRIMVNMKGIQPREADNIAWFVLSSNHQKPLQLDSSSSGNRRFSIINTGGGIALSKGKKINETISNPNNVSNYLAWLLNEFPEVPSWEGIQALQNEDKELLTEASESYVDKFFSWMERTFPNVNKISTRERNHLLDVFRTEMGEEGFQFDSKYGVQYFNNSLPHHVQAKKVSIRGKSVNGYSIDREIEKDALGYFENDRYERESFQFELSPVDIVRKR